MFGYVPNYLSSPTESVKTDKNRHAPLVCEMTSKYTAILTGTCLHCVYFMNLLLVLLGATLTISILT